MSEKVDFTDDVCIHTGWDCNCMTAKEKRIQNMFNIELNALKNDIRIYSDENSVLRALLDAANLELGKLRDHDNWLDGMLVREKNKVIELESSLARMREAIELTKKFLDDLQPQDAIAIVELKNLKILIEQALQESSATNEKLEDGFGSS